jgi:hypothetical protein
MLRVSIEVGKVQTLAELLLIKEGVAAFGAFCAAEFNSVSWKRETSTPLIHLTHAHTACVYLNRNH